MNFKKIYKKGLIFQKTACIRPVWLVGCFIAQVSLIEFNNSNEIAVFLLTLVTLLIVS